MRRLRPARLVKSRNSQRIFGNENKNRKTTAPRSFLPRTPLHPVTPRCSPPHSAPPRTPPQCTCGGGFKNSNLYNGIRGFVLKRKVSNILLWLKIGPQPAVAAVGGSLWPRRFAAVGGSLWPRRFATVGGSLRSRRFATVGRSQPNSLSQRFTAPGGSRRNNLSYWACKAGPQPAERPQTKRQRVAGLRRPKAAARAAQ